MTKVYAGIDPGMVDTGVVCLVFDEDARQCNVKTLVANGIEPEAYEQVAQFLRQLEPSAVFIEDYRARQHFKNDVLMIRAVDKFAAQVATPVLINNTGSKQVLRPALLDLLQIKKFEQRTHHRDLEAAARILVYGMLKNPEGNRLLTKLVQDTLASAEDESKSWTIKKGTN